MASRPPGEAERPEIRSQATGTFGSPKRPDGGVGWSVLLCSCACELRVGRETQRVSAELRAGPGTKQCTGTGLGLDLRVKGRNSGTIISVQQHSLPAPGQDCEGQTEDSAAEGAVGAMNLFLRMTLHMGCSLLFEHGGKTGTSRWLRGTLELGPSCDVGGNK